MRLFITALVVLFAVITVLADEKDQPGTNECRFLFNNATTYIVKVDTQKDLNCRQVRDNDKTFSLCVRVTPNQMSPEYIPPLVQAFLEHVDGSGQIQRLISLSFGRIESAYNYGRSSCETALGNFEISCIVE